MASGILGKLSYPNLYKFDDLYRLDTIHLLDIIPMAFTTPRNKKHWHLPNRGDTPAWQTMRSFATLMSLILAETKNGKSCKIRNENLGMIFFHTFQSCFI